MRTRTERRPDHEPSPRLRPGGRALLRSRLGLDYGLELEVVEVVPAEGDATLARVRLPSVPDAPGTWVMAGKLVPLGRAS